MPSANSNRPDQSKIDRRSSTSPPCKMKKKKKKKRRARDDFYMTMAPSPVATNRTTTMETAKETPSEQNKTKNPSSLEGMKRKEDPHDALLLFFNPPRPYLLLFHPSLMISKCIDPCEFVLDGREHPSATRVLKTSAVNHLAKCTSAILKEPNVAKFLASLHFLYFSRSLFLICRLSRRFFHK